jgi:hypothetical protein
MVVFYASQGAEYLGRSIALAEHVYILFPVLPIEWRQLTRGSQDILLNDGLQGSK